MTHQNEQNGVSKNAQISATGREKEAGNNKIRDLELGDMEKHYGLKETLNYVRGLDMENPDHAGSNPEDTGELAGD
jgi:hypothetical protein